MPCICHGAISGKEMFDEEKRLNPENWNRILEHLKCASSLIRKTPINAECMDYNWLGIWKECFSHLLHDCPEKIIPDPGEPPA